MCIRTYYSLIIITLANNPWSDTCPFNCTDDGYYAICPGVLISFQIILARLILSRYYASFILLNMIFKLYYKLIFVELFLKELRIRWRLC